MISPLAENVFLAGSIPGIYQHVIFAAKIYFGERWDISNHFHQGLHSIAIIRHYYLSSDFFAFHVGTILNRGYVQILFLTDTLGEDMRNLFKKLFMDLDPRIRSCVMKENTVLKYIQNWSEVNADNGDNEEEEESIIIDRDTAPSNNLSCDACDSSEPRYTSKNNRKNIPVGVWLKTPDKMSHFPVVFSRHLL